jgi:hypothetical protein
MGLWGDIWLSCGGEFSLSLNETCISPTYHFLITKCTTHVDVSYRNTGFQSLSVVGDTHGSAVNESFHDRFYCKTRVCFWITEYTTYVDV